MLTYIAATDVPKMLIKYLLNACLVCLLLIGSRSAIAENGSEKVADDIGEQTQIERQAKVTQFSVWEYRVSGNTLLQKTMIERALTPYLGPDKSADVINQAADALERIYRDQGYPVVYIDIPEQNVVAGVVELVVNETKTSRLRVTGARYFTLRSLKEKVPSLRSGQTIHLPSVQSEIQNLHSYTTDLQAVPILKAGRTPGTMEIELKVKDKLPLHGSVELNNYHSANTTKTRLETSIGYDNLWQKFHSFRITAQTTPEKTDEVRVLVANYIMPVDDASNRLAFYAVKSSSDIAILNDLSVVGQGNIYGARYVIPLQADREASQSVSIGLDYKDVEDAINLQNIAAIKTPISYLVASGSYSATVYGEDSTTSFSISVNAGIRGPNRRSEFEVKRFKGSPDFIYFRGDIERTDTFFSDIRLKTQLKYQLTDSPLISNEQFSIGGHSTVRGYYESQALGDNGVAASIELHTPQIKPFENYDFNMRAYAFIDGASVSTVEPLSNELTHEELISSGLGMYVTKSKHLSLKIDWAKPMRTVGDAGSGTLTSKGDQRVTASLRYAF